MINRSLFMEVKKLRVFDLDDTLVQTNSYIYVKQKNGTEKKLTPAQFAVYTERPDEIYDFRDFNNIIEPFELFKITKILKRIVASNKDGVYILTARPQAVEKHVHKYLKDIGITRKIPVVGLASNNPLHKADWIEMMIDKYGYNDVFFADDSPKNIAAVGNMLKRKNVKGRVQLVKH